LIILQAETSNKTPNKMQIQELLLLQKLKLKLSHSFFASSTCYVDKDHTFFSYQNFTNSSFSAWNIKKQRPCKCTTFAKINYILLY